MTDDTIVYCDNVIIVYMSTDLTEHQRTKHIKIYIHFSQDKVVVGLVRDLHVPSSSQYVDIFTMGLPTILFLDFKNSLNVHRSPDQMDMFCGLFVLV